MGRVLKICLAMGGGVSLGSFSGSALTEALKLLVLYGQDNDGNPYDDIVVDGMSGASAGTVALVIMLKTLIDYKAMMPHLKAVTHQSLTNDISKRYFNNDLEKTKNFSKLEDLKALEVAQRVQHAIWVNELTAKELFGKEKINDYTPNINESFSLLDKQLLEKLAKQYLINTKIANLNNVRVLDKVRVPFACSLTNLLPIEIKKNQSNLPKLEENVIQSVGAQNHSELRVIDFVFNNDALQNKPTDERWLKLSLNPDNEAKRVFNLFGEKAWATVCASALACAAFPIAFAPVMLKRYKEEFDGHENNGQWPLQFNKLNAEYNRLKNNNKKGVFSLFNEATDNVITYKNFNFPYVDGGTFNNEPIKEAYKIGTFQDFGKDSKNFDRLILFVDPIVRTQKYQDFTQPALTPIKMKEKEAFAKDEVSKFIGVTTSLITTLKNQGRIKEEHKISGIKENLELRQTIFNYLDNNNHLSDTLDFDLIKTAYQKVTSSLKSHIISIGTRDVITYFKNELKKTCTSLNQPNSRCVSIDDTEFKELQVLIEKTPSNTKFDPEGYQTLKIENPEDKNIFARTIFKIIFDFSLNTDGKNENATRVAILPINSKNNIISLPGEELSAFGGFASLKARQYAFNYGKLSTLKSLSAGKNGFRNTQKPFIDLKNNATLEKTFISEIDNIAFFKNLDSYQKNVEENLVRLAVKRLVVMVKAQLNTKNLFKIFKKVTLGLLGRLIFKLHKFLKIVSDKLFKTVKTSVQVNHKALLPVTISVLSNSRLPLTTRITTTKNELVKLKMHENQAKDVGAAYQYLFQVYYAPYKKKTTPKIAKAELIKANTYFLETHNVKKIALTLAQKVKIPSTDGNLNQNMTQELESGFKQIISEIKIGNHTLPQITQALNNKESMLHYSFLNIKYHVNPLIEINLNHDTKQWYFKENTTALHKILS